jgi:putative sigma-54 modulation protein
MKLEFIEKNYEIGAKLATIMAKKIGKLDKYFTDDSKARIVCRKENKTYKLELTITSQGLLYRAEVTGENMYENIDVLLPKIERQILKSSDKKKASFRKNAFDDAEYMFIDEKPEYNAKDIIKRKSFEIDPITVDEAKMMIDNVEHDFYIFLNANTGKVNVIYKRHDNDLGLIEVNY